MNAAFHAPDKLGEMFPAPGLVSRDTGFVNDAWYEPVYARPAPEGSEM